MSRDLHGHTKLSSGKWATPTYSSWHNARKRCYTVTNNRYPFYGALGVVMCDRWKSFSNFLEDMGERPEGTTLDRIDPTGNYEPDNCRWATPAEQAKNKRKHHSA